MALARAFGGSGLDADRHHTLGAIANRAAGTEAERNKASDAVKDNRAELARIVAGDTPRPIRQVVWAAPCLRVDVVPQTRSLLPRLPLAHAVG